MYFQTKKQHLITTSPKISRVFFLFDQQELGIVLLYLQSFRF
jgi:hypothetical protein